MSDSDQNNSWFWPAFVVGAVVLVAVGVFVENGKLRPKTAPVQPVSVVEAYNQLMSDGLRDAVLEYDRTGQHSGMLPFHKTFGDARNLGISATELASTGRYFGARPLPLKVQVTPEGRIKLVDGRKRLLAAQMAGATSILVDVSVDERHEEVVLKLV